MRADDTTWAWKGAAQDVLIMMIFFFFVHGMVDCNFVRVGFLVGVSGMCCHLD